MNKLQNTVNQLFGLFQEGQWDDAAKLFAENALILPQYGQQITAMTVPEFIQSAKEGPLSKVGLPVYVGRKVNIVGINGFVEQHQTVLTIRGKELKIPVCLVGKFDTSGKISRLEEYLDPTPIALALQS